MLTISDKYAIDTDKYQYILIEIKRGINKEGNPTKRERRTYHATLRQSCGEIIDREAKEVLSGMSGVIENKVSELEKGLELRIKHLIRGN